MAASLYRRHRPRTFADVVGQEHVVRTLSNAIEQGRVHHAYLFVGSRGTGKTSMAKILAASLNCQGESGGGTGPSGPTITPCGTCESCRSIATATSLDVVEMDAASNNSVDDIRDLRERVGYAPVGGGYKVYILDEAHMLTSAAWNAFLKTLEEPPPHTIFVLATTEANKVLPTVVDRCHRFDFGRPSVVQIASVLRRAADSESIEIPDEAIALVARSATGSFRDALGTLEQLLAYSGSSIVLDDVLAVLGAADADLLFGTLDAISAGDARSALLAAARLADSGRDLGRFFGDLEAHARGLLITQVLGAVPAELSVTPEQDERLAEQSKRVGGAEIVRLLELIAFALRAMKDGADPRTQLELALVKAAKPDLEPTVKALQARIARLESAPPAPAPPRTPDRPETPAGRAVSAPATPPSGDASAAGRAPAPSGPGQAAATRPAPAPASADRATPAPAAGTPAPAAGTPAPAAGTPAPAAGSPRHAAGSPARAAAPPAHAAATPAHAAAPSANAAGPTTHAAAPPAQAAGSPTHGAPAPAQRAAPAPTAPTYDEYGVPHHTDSDAPAFVDSGAPSNGGSAPAHGRTDVHIHAEVDGQPIDVSATLPGAGHATAQEAQRAAETMAGVVSHELATATDPTPAVTATATVDHDAPAPAPSLELSLDTLGQSWPAVLAELREGSPMLAAALDDCAPAALTGNGLTLAWPETSSFLKRKAEDPANKELLVKAIRSVTGSSLRLAYELRSESDPMPTLTATAPSAPKLTEDDLVQRFMEEFDAEELPPDPEEQT